MAEITITYGNSARARSETIDSRRLDLAGFILCGSPRGHYPSAVTVIDGDKKAEHYPTPTTRVHVLFPHYNDTDGTRFITGTFETMVDIRGEDDHGWGEIYVGNGNTPSYYAAFILPSLVRYYPERELAFVEQTNIHSIVHPERFELGHGLAPHFLAYDTPDIIEVLGPLRA